jgi:sarcosine oxidase subunit beta
LLILNSKAIEMKMKKIYDVVIIGGGVHGLSLAYNLAKGGMRRVAIIEKSYIGSGASGRNGEAVRSGFAHEAWLRFYNKSLQIWETLSQELDFNIMFTQCGYLIMASSPKKMDVCRLACEKHQEFGLKTRLLDTNEIRMLIPALNPRLIFGGIYQPNGGYARHDGVVWAYERAAGRLCVEIFPFTEVKAINVDNSAVKGVRTSKGDIETPTVVNAAGGHANHIASMVGFKLPNKTYRLEMLATEPIKPFLKEYLGTLDLMGYMHQTARGEFVGGTETPDLIPSMKIKSTLMGIKDMATKFVSLFPRLAGVRVMRQWSGLINQALDGSPVLGPISKVDGFILDCGWTYGFMGAPAAGKYLADYILTGELPSLIRPFSPERFKTGELVIDPSLVISTEAEKKLNLEE